MIPPHGLEHPRRDAQERGLGDRHDPDAPEVGGAARGGPAPVAEQDVAGVGPGVRAGRPGVGPQADVVDDELPASMDDAEAGDVAQARAGHRVADDGELGMWWVVVKRPGHGDVSELLDGGDGEGWTRG